MTKTNIEKAENDIDTAKDVFVEQSRKITELWAQYGRLQAQREQGMAIAENARQQMIAIYQKIAELEKK